MKKSLEMFTGKRKKITTILIGVFILIAISLACNLPFKIVGNGGSGTDQTASDQVKTDADDVSAASNDQGEESKVEESVEGDQVLPSETPTATPSATETVTPTPEPAIANVEQNINCRLGPKDVYDLVHIFSKGDVVNILGKNEAETFWFVEDQGSGSIKCWLWREYTNTEGATKYVPVFTPPPEPAPPETEIARLPPRDPRTKPGTIPRDGKSSPDSLCCPPHTPHQPHPRQLRSAAKPHRPPHQASTKDSSRHRTPRHSPARHCRHRSSRPRRRPR